MMRTSILVGLSLGVILTVSLLFAGIHENWFDLDADVGYWVEEYNEVMRTSYQLFVDDNYCYVVGGIELRIIEIPETEFTFGYIFKQPDMYLKRERKGYCPGDIYVNENLLFITANENCPVEVRGKRDFSLKLYDVSNPDEPFQMYKDKSHHIRNVAASDSFLYAINDDSKFLVFDFSYPRNPEVKDSMQFDDSIWDIAIDDSLVFLVGNIYLIILAVRDPSNPQSIAKFDYSRALSDVTHRALLDMCLHDNTVFILSYDYIVSIDVSVPVQPEVTSVFHFNQPINDYRDQKGLSNSVKRAYIYDFAVEKDNLYMTEYNKIWVVNYRNQHQPYIVTMYSSELLQAAFTDIFARNSMLYTVDREGLSVFDISKPGTLKFSGRVRF